MNIDDILQVVKPWDSLLSGTIGQHKAYYRLPIIMLHIGVRFQRLSYRKEEAGFTLTNSLTGLVENAVKEDILNRFVQPVYLP
jgi:hypothetical protein